LAKNYNALTYIPNIVSEPTYGHYSKSSLSFSTDRHIIILKTPQDILAVIPIQLCDLCMLTAANK